MDYYHTFDFSEYESMKRTIFKHYGEILKYENEEYTLQYLDYRTIEKCDRSIVFSGFCVLADKQGKYIQLSIKTVYDIINQMFRVDMN